MSDVAREVDLIDTGNRRIVVSEGRLLRVQAWDEVKGWEDLVIFRTSPYFIHEMALQLAGEAWKGMEDAR